GIFAPIQEAAIVALDNSEEITNHLRNVFAKRHRILKEGLLQLGWEVAPSVGGMFIWAKYPYDIPDKDFAFEVIRQVGVVVVRSGIFAPIQEAAIVALDNSEEITNHLRNVFAKRHRILKEGLLQLGWEVAPSVGGMFIWAKYPYDIPDKDFAFEVIRQVGVVVV